ncbi:MAG: UDP-N-acetylmuramate--L-alanine ligase [Planctomycetes bacterium]|nr:UDP-N-acetylmuramate--L-alanine ligase [Planctomycetota bacterium]
MATVPVTGLLERVRELLRKDSAVGKVHFVGIGGIGMSGLARCLLSEGVEVSGSDLTASETTQALASAGVRLFLGHSPDHVPGDAQFVVRSAAIRDENPELARARLLGLPVLKYAQLLGRISETRRTVAVAGCHGKTTTTAMVASILSVAGKDPSFVIGGQVPCLGGSSRAGKGPHFVVEACEFDRSFHNLHPRTAIITNIEEDHLDYYRDLNEIVESFATYAARVPAGGLVVANAEDPRALSAARRGAARIETFALAGEATWTAKTLEIRDGRRRIQLLREGRVFAECRLRVPGRHNVANALAAVAAAVDAGATPADVERGLESFGGVARRLHFLGEPRGVAVLDDYGHHPTEIRTVLSSLREIYPGRRLCCVFQPHQHSRTRHLLGEFAVALAGADLVLLPDIYGARDTEEDKKSVSSAMLAERIPEAGGRARYVGTFDAVRAFARSGLAAGDVLVVMGAGSIGTLAPQLVRDLSALEPSDACTPACQVAP